MDEKTLIEIFSRDNPYVLPRPIIDAYENGKLIIFLGAGISRLMGTMGWDQLADSLINVAYPNYRERKEVIDSIRSSKEKITIAHEKMKEDDLLEKFYCEFGKALKPKRGKKSQENNENIYEIISKFDAVFLTTNSDDLFEKTKRIAHVSENFDTVFISEPAMRKRTLFYLHGKFKYGKSERTIAHNEANLIFTTENYVRHYNDERVCEFLRCLFQDEENTVLFLGYGLNEYELIDYTLQKAGYNESGHYRRYILEGYYSNQDSLFWARQKYFRTMGVQVIPYNMDNREYKEQVNVLNSWLEQLNDKTTLPINLLEDVEFLLNDCNKAHAEKLAQWATEEFELLDLEIAKRIGTSPQLKKWMDLLLNETDLYSRKTMMSVFKCNPQSWKMLELLSVINFSTIENQKMLVRLVNNLQDIAYQEVSLSSLPIYSSIICLTMKLDKNHIADKNIEFISDSAKKYPCILIYITTNEKFNCSIYLSWSDKNIRKLWDSFFSYISDIEDSNQDAEAVEILKLFISNLVGEKKLIYIHWANSFLSKTNQKEYSLFRRIHNLENIEEVCGNGFALFFWDTFKNVFCDLNQDERAQIIEEMLVSDSPVQHKCALNLLRNEKCEFHVDEQHFQKIMERDSLGELGLYIAKFACQLSKDEKEKLKKEFTEMKKESFSYASPVIQSIIELLSINQSSPHSNDRESLSDILDQYDGVSTIKERNFNKRYSSKTWWADYLEDFGVKDEFSHFEIARDAIASLITFSLSELTQALSIKATDVRAFYHIACQLPSFFKELESDRRISLSVFLLDQLIDCWNGGRFSTICARNAMLCISMLKLEEVDQNIFSKTSKCLEKWSKIPMYYDDINGENDLIFSIINGANYPAIELHIHWLYWKYNIQKSNFEDSDFEFIKEWCKRDEEAALSYCYNLSNLLRIVGSDDALRTKVFEFFTQESDNNRVQTMVCMCGSRYIYPQLIAALQMQIKDTACMEDFFEGRDESLIRYVCKYISGAYVYGIADECMVESLLANGIFTLEYIQNIGTLHNKEKFAFTDYLCRFWNKIKENLERRKDVKIIEAILRSVRFVNIPSVEILNMFIEAERLLPDDCKFNVELSNISKLYSVDFNKAHSFVCALLRHCYYVKEQDLEEIHIHYVHDDSIRDQKVQLSNILRECNLINLNQYKKWNLS